MSIALFRFGGQDSQEVKAVPAIVNIYMCDCTGDQGECVFETVREGDFNATFKMVECNCTDGWIGTVLCTIFVKCLSFLLMRICQS